MATVRLACNGCNVERQAQTGQSLDTLRDKLGTVGWLSDKANDRDACPSCLESGRMLAAR